MFHTQFVCVMYTFCTNFNGSEPLGLNNCSQNTHTLPALAQSVMSSSGATDVLPQDYITVVGDKCMV